MTNHTVYHTGYLPVDRLSDPVLDAKAEEYLERGTAVGTRVRKGEGPEDRRGLGEGFLTQRRIWAGVYEYRFTPTRRHSNEGLE